MLAERDQVAHAEVEGVQERLAELGTGGVAGSGAVEAQEHEGRELEHDAAALRVEHRVFYRERLGWRIAAYLLVGREVTELCRRAGRAKHAGDALLGADRTAFGSARVNGDARVACCPYQQGQCIASQERIKVQVRRAGEESEVRNPCREGGGGGSRCRCREPDV